MRKSGKANELTIVVSILGDEKGVRFEIEDRLSGITFLEFTMTPEEFCQAALGRLGCVPCKAELRRLDIVGLKMEHKPFEFEMPSSDGDWRVDKEVAKAESVRLCPKGWESDQYFGSKDSFFQKDGKQWARCIIRRYVPVE